MTALSAAMERQHYELAALRLLLAVLATIDEAAGAAPEARTALLELLTPPSTGSATA